MEMPMFRFQSYAEGSMEKNKNRQNIHFESRERIIYEPRCSVHFTAFLWHLERIVDISYMYPYHFRYMS